MKKILGILGITLIIAVSFFNMSSVVDVNQNVNLASIIQNASADSEVCDLYDTFDYILVTVQPMKWVNGVYVNDGDSYQCEITKCYGWGPNPCTEIDECHL